MTKKKRIRVKALIERIPSLTNGQIYWLDRVTRIFENPSHFSVVKSDIIDETTLNDFGDALRIHHGFSDEPFSKDKFEYVLEKVMNLSGHRAKLAPKGLQGHDIEIDEERISLKTQADKDIKENKIWISKFMELGRGEWSDNPEDLIGLRKMFINHLSNYERILVLRALSKAPNWHYELVEIPINVLRKSKNGKLEMKLDSRQLPKPGYCYVSTKTGIEIFQLYFDGGTERKLQIKNLLKSKCKIHASWRFSIPAD